MSTTYSSSDEEVAEVDEISLRVTSPEVEIEDDEAEELEKLRNYNRGRKRRAGISAGTGGDDDDEAWEPPVYEKTEEELERIFAVCDKNILFSDLDKEQRKLIGDAIFSKELKDGDVIIQQGDTGDYFYVIDSGICDVFVNGNKVLRCKQNDSFGELALMYDSPRAATVQSVGESRLWALDRKTFKRILLNSTKAKRERYGNFLASIEFLNPLCKYDQMTLADALESHDFKAGDVIIREGDIGDQFFIVESGSVVVHKGNDETVLCELTTGQYFGELALILNEQRRATVQAGDNGATVLSLQAATFHRLLGSLSDLLMEHKEVYNKVLRENGFDEM